MTAVAPVTPNQTKFIRDLLDRKDLFKSPRFSDSVNAMDREEFSQYMLHLKARAATVSKRRASEWIDSLLALPDKESAEPKARPANRFRDDVPAGRYAVEGSDGTTDFYKVDRPTEGRWAGYVFVKLLIASGGHGVESLSEQRIAPVASRTVLGRIAEAGVQESMQRFGREIGSCGHCGRVLTNEDSRALGIGPVCAGKMGW